MKKYDSRLVGILGTVIIHLIAAIIFMLFKIGSQQKIIKEQFTVEFVPQEEIYTPEKKEQPINLPTTSVEKVLKGDNEMLNIARNLANKSNPKVDAQEYIDMVKNELIKSGKLGVDNFIDEQKMKAEQGDEDISTENQVKKADPQSEKPSASQELAANYKGPTRIYYDLQGRNHTYLPIPIYMCQGSGKITLAIAVNQKGDVESAKVISSESTTSDPCLVETAVNTALMSRFNYDEKAPKSQSGTLTYHFVAQ
ncbi:MAG TPA: hypothetical protein VK155_04305 [Bacteroidales bacterium]|jgi:outer membrane biosynthesis protein TonB|nr:hypothetical protein [Bacteroidales bacterium]